MLYKIISSGSSGNAAVYCDNIMVDCGVTRSLLDDYVSKLSIVLLTHEHKDHFNLTTIKRLEKERPSLRFACGAHLAEPLKNVRNVDIVEAGTIYNYGSFAACPVILYHDVPNFGWRIFYGDKKIFHATDTAHLQGITAKDYDLYCLEANYDEERVYEVIREKRLRGEYPHQIGAINSHLSIQQAQNFFLQNRTEGKGEIVILHQSKEF